MPFPSPYAAAPMPRRRSLGKTLLVAAFIAYSPLLLILATVVLWTGTLANDRTVSSLFTGGSVAIGAVAAFAYLFSAPIALIYVDRRDNPASFSVGRAVGSSLLLVFAVLLPILIGGIVVFAIALAGSSIDGTRP